MKKNQKSNNNIKSIKSAKNASQYKGEKIEKAAKFNKREVLEIITPVIENTTMRYNLIPLEISLERESGRHFLRIYIYSSDHPVSHLDCEKISRSLGDMLDELIPFKYFLEVSSPGLERKFKSEREYILFKGHNVTLKLKEDFEDIKLENSGQKIIDAKLLDYNESFGAKILYNEKEYVIPLETIQYTKLNDSIEIK